jgi:adenylyltransferase/sulfurtransferase
MNSHLISTHELHQLLNEGTPLQLIDVRTLEKHMEFNIGGTLMPIDELPKRLKELNQDNLIVTYCTSGGKSMIALNYLLSVGFKMVKSLDGGVTAWKKDDCQNR